VPVGGREDSRNSNAALVGEPPVAPAKGRALPRVWVGEVVLAPVDIKATSGRRWVTTRASYGVRRHNEAAGAWSAYRKTLWHRLIAGAARAISPCHTGSARCSWIPCACVIPVAESPYRGGLVGDGHVKHGQSPPSAGPAHGTQRGTVLFSCQRAAGATGVMSGVGRGCQWTLGWLAVRRCTGGQATSGTRSIPQPLLCKGPGSRHVRAVARRNDEGQAFVSCHHHWPSAGWRTHGPPLAFSLACYTRTPERRAWTSRGVARATGRDSRWSGCENGFSHQRGCARHGQTPPSAGPAHGTRRFSHQRGHWWTNHQWHPSEGSGGQATSGTRQSPTVARGKAPKHPT
jgi:hypothetical protein